MQVFHGSDVRIEKIDLAKSEYFKDFGRGFYVTSIHEHAYQRAMDIVKRHKSEKPIITEFNYIETYPVTVGLKIKKFETISREWVEFILLNRNRQISHPAHTFDIIEGPIANDKMFLQIKLYEQGKISIDKLVEKLTFRELTHQICFYTISSLYSLEFIEDKEFHAAVDYITGNILETLIAENEITESEAIKMFYFSETNKRLINTDTLLWQKSWQDIYKMIKKEI